MPTVASWTGPPIALFWDQSLVWGVICVETLERTRIPFRLLDSGDIRAGALDAHRVLLVPGGWALHKARALGEEGAERVRDFVHRGGSYLGFCGGAGLALSAPQALGLTPTGRMPLSERLPNASGEVWIRGNPDHPLWRDIPAEVPVSIWWPGQFGRNSGNADRTVAVYARPGTDFRVADLTPSDLDWHDVTWEATEETYGINLNPARLMGQPAIMETRTGLGTVLLSYPHLETPGEPWGNRLLENALRHLDTCAAKARSAHETGQLDKEAAHPAHVDAHLAHVDAHPAPVGACTSDNAAHPVHVSAHSAEDPARPAHGAAHPEHFAAHPGHVAPDLAQEAALPVHGAAHPSHETAHSAHMAIHDVHDTAHPGHAGAHPANPLSADPLSEASPGPGTLRHLASASALADDLIAFGERHLLWNWRRPWLLNWRRGVRGLEYGMLAILLRHALHLLQQGRTDPSHGLALDTTLPEPNAAASPGQTRHPNREGSTLLPPSAQGSAPLPPAANDPTPLPPSAEDPTLLPPFAKGGRGGFLRPPHQSGHNPISTTAETHDPWIETAHELHARVSEFRALSRRLLIEEKIASQSGIVPKIGSVNATVDSLRSQLFGGRMNHEGLARTVFDPLDKLLLNLLRMKTPQKPGHIHKGAFSFTPQF